MTVSVLCPSRDRPEMLGRSVESLRALAVTEPEILVAADDDDPATAAVARALGVRLLVRERAGYARLHEYYAGLAAASTGTWLLIWNDDATMLTGGWDGVLERLPASVLVADVQSPYSPGLCCFPAVRREAAAALGRFSTDNPHVDTFWQDAGRATGTIAPVSVRADCESPVKPGQTHGYYEASHQAELAACSQRLAGWMAQRDKDEECS